MQSFSRILSIIPGVLMLPGFALAQGERGAITGSVVDSSGALVPDAAMTITETKTSVTSTVKSSSAGYYRLPVPPGTYRVAASKEGFKTAVAENAVVGVAQVVTIDFRLQVGSTTQSVTVTSEAPLLTPSSPEVGTSITPQEFQTLPILVDDGLRQLQTFIFTSLPGTVGDPFAGSINGGQAFTSEILIDGISIARYDLSGGSLVEMSPSADATSEFKVQGSNYSAQYGESNGGIANFGMKSGTNEYHGTAYEYLKNDVFNATGFNVNSRIIEEGNPLKDVLKRKPPLRENNFGAGFGGPISIPHVYSGKNRTFFYANYEGERRIRPTPGNLITMPTVRMTQGDFSQWLGNQVGTDLLGRPVFFGQVYDPATSRSVTVGQVDPVTKLVATDSGTIRDPFPGNIVPPSSWSKVSTNVDPFFPVPILDRTLRNYPSISTCCPKLRVDTVSTRIDHVINERHKLSSFFNFNHRPRLNSVRRWPPIPGLPLNPLQNQTVEGRILRIAEDWTINDHTLNHFALGYNRFSNNNNMMTLDQNWPQKIGLQGVEQTTFPSINFSGSGKQRGQALGHFGGTTAGFAPSESYIIANDLSHLRGKHDFRFGFEYRRYRYNVRDRGNTSGSFQFRPDQTGLPGSLLGQTGNAFASFLLGDVRQVSRNFTPVAPGYRVNFLALYAQDDMKLTPKLTLNLGLRWEYPGPEKEAFNRISGLEPNGPNPGANNIPGVLAFLGKGPGRNGRDSFQDAYYGEFGPRVGFAYNPTKKLVFRGGYGISYGPPILNNFGTHNIQGFNGSLLLRPDLLGLKKYQAVLNWDNPVPPPPCPFPCISPTFANLNGPNMGVLDWRPKDSARQPYTQNWSIGFQYELPLTTLLEANYVGSKGTRLLSSPNSNGVNQVNSKFIALGDILADDLATDLADPTIAPTLAQYGITGLPYPSFSGSVAQGIRPFPQYDVITNLYPNFGNSTYHSLQVTARKRSTKGLSFIAAYTFSKSLANSDSALYYPTGGFGFYFFAQDYYNRRAEKSIAGFDVPQFLKPTEPGPDTAPGTKSP